MGKGGRASTRITCQVFTIFFNTVLFLVTGLALLVTGSFFEVALTVSNTTGDQCSFQEEDYLSIDSIKQCFNVLCEVFQTGPSDTVCSVVGSAPTVAITAGVFMLGVAVMGIVGAVKRLPRVLIAYIVIVSFLLLLQVGIAASGFALAPYLKEGIQQVWYSRTDVQKAKVESLFGCCGVTGNADGCTTTAMCDDVISTLVVSNPASAYLIVSIVMLALQLLGLTAIGSVRRQIVREKYLSVTPSNDVAEALSL
eukprot:CAMPEP_0113906808 /NCGR_PEP_ID=MMETSP0780_2-20120614/25024_1 /TAXON_ID=652834 /ORGANISM="Palpitomonas bilix" /LENGTH=252 /DNA_ID=CAMNT_0000901591 /DNA_START=168 /DNA_END=926 /DNA_ORIENTATION=+ /assembly_acc=CAM_ASM_000599